MTPIIPGNLYCVETSVEVFAPESIRICLNIDGVEKANVKFAYYYPLDFFKVQAIAMPKNYRAHSTLFDDFTISSFRLYAIPGQPKNCAGRIDSNRVTLRCDKYKTSYQGEYLKACQWRIFQNGSSNFPIYNAIEREAAYLNERTVPFLLDSGSYQWQARFLNNFGQWGDWSAAQTVRVNTPLSRKISIKEISFTKAGTNVPVTEIQAGQWIDLHLRLVSESIRDTLFYAIVWLNDTTYTLGNAANKGGGFLSSSSYIYNISLAEKELSLFEKPIENSVVSRAVKSDSVGLYINGKVVFDSLHRKITLRVRVLSQANPGTWQVSGCLFYLLGRDKDHDMITGQSAVIRNFISVTKSKEIRISGYFLLIIGLSALLAGFIIFQRKRIKRAHNPKNQLFVPADPDFMRICEYIEKNINENITGIGILADLAISKDRFYKIMRQHDQKLPQLINEIRIKKAKELMVLETNKSISEIAIFVGFKDEHNFYRVFKKIEGITAKEYRNSMKKT